MIRKNAMSTDDCRSMRMRSMVMHALHRGTQHVPARRTWSSIASLVLLIVAAPELFVPGAAAQSWPQRPVTLILPYPPGGNVDTQARIMGERLSAKLGQPFIIQNKA